MGSITTKAGETDITPLNGYVRVQDVAYEDDGRTMRGTVTDIRDSWTEVEYGDVVYFPKTAAVIMRVNGKEICFVGETDIVFKVGG